MKPKIILASKSITRKRFLAELGVPFEVIVSEIDETIFKKKYPDPKELVVKLAETKTEKVARQCKNSIVIGADTVLIYDNFMLGKPKSLEEATDMLIKLSGKRHNLFSGFCVINTITNEKILKFIDVPIIFNTFSEEDVKKYFETCDPTKYAGAYVLNDIISLGWVKQYSGDARACAGFDFNILTSVLRNAGYLSLNE